MDKGATKEPVTSTPAWTSWRSGPELARPLSVPPAPPYPSYQSPNYTG